MCALAHYFEEAGLATTAIALIREHAERIRPPRALWVPFELGRPLGPPSDAAFQRRVLGAALEQLIAADRPGTIIDFPDNDPRSQPDDQWTPPVIAEDHEMHDGSRFAEYFLKEVSQLAPYYEKVLATTGRTTVGLLGRPIPAVAEYVASFLRGRRIPSLISNMSPTLALRFAADDLKAYYLESALATGGQPSSRQLLDWFWASTWGGGALFAVRAMALASSDEKLQRIGERFLVPRARVVRSEGHGKR